MVWLYYGAECIYNVNFLYLGIRNHLYYSDDEVTDKNYHNRALRIVNMILQTVTFMNENIFNIHCN